MNHRLLLLSAALALGLAACQPSGDESDVGLTSGPAPETSAAEDAVGQATNADAAPAGEAEAEPAQQSAPATADAGDMGDAQTREESVEPDSPTMFH